MSRVDSLGRLCHYPLFSATSEKKLTLLFLVNDVLQHSKRKGPQFVDAFGHILPKCMADYKDLESKAQIERMLDIWESREVFHKHIISAMKYNLGLFLCS